MSRILPYAMLIPLLFIACDRSQEGAKAQQASSAKHAPDKSDSKEAKAGSPSFDHTKKWSPCAAMPASVAAKVVGVPEGNLETNEFGKICIHDRKGGSDSTEAYAQLGALNVFETAKKAKFRFEASTRDTSAADMKKMNDEIRKKGKKELDKEANAEAKKKAADDVVDALGGAVSYEAVKGVGDEAAMSKQDGQLHVRAGNAYFYVLAWAGPAIGDRSAASTEEIKKKRLAHLGKNWDKQKKLQIELAKAIVDNMQ